MKIKIKKENIKNTSCIYLIENIISKKKYIGQTTNLRKRISDYKNADKKSFGMYEIIKKEGIDNFSFEVLEFCDSDKLTNRENYYIKKYNTTNPNFGYNIVLNNNPTQNSEKSRKKKSLSHIGLKESSKTKRKKSNKVIAIKGSTMIVSESGKLIGDFFGKNKDMVKNALRQPTVICEYHIYYDDFYKRQTIRDKMNKKRSIRNKTYMKNLDILDKIEKEGLETIYEYFDIIYSLSYDNIDIEGKPIPTVLGTF